MLLKKTSWQLSFVAIALLTITGCADHNKSKPSPDYAHSKFGYEGTSDASFAAAGASDTNNVAATNSTPVDNTPPATNPFLSATPQPASARDLPYGTPVPGKPGFVTSPHSPNAGYVDIRGFPPGTEVKDPYSGKVFLVP